MKTHPFPVVFCEVHDFLGCTSTLDGCVGEGEDGVAAAERLDGGERLDDVLTQVVGAHHPVILQRRLQSFHLENNNYLPRLSSSNGLLEDSLKMGISFLLIETSSD